MQNFSKKDIEWINIFFLKLSSPNKNNIKWINYQIRIISYCKYNQKNKLNITELYNYDF